MMADYIKREDAQTELCRDCYSCKLGCNRCCPTALRVKNLPAEDVAPVRHGLWEGEADGYADGAPVYDVWYCSECGYCVDEGNNHPPRYNYCPNCGAKMDKEAIT